MLFNSQVLDEETCSKMTNDLPVFVNWPVAYPLNSCPEAAKTHRKHRLAFAWLVCVRVGVRGGFLPEASFLKASLLGEHCPPFRGAISSSSFVHTLPSIPSAAEATAEACA